jgi:DNA-binding GntR family transcriptional regulator
MAARSDSVLSAADRARYDSVEARRATLQAHLSIDDAIERRDPERAFELMAGHVRGSASPLLQSLVLSASHAALEKGA